MTDTGGRHALMGRIAPAMTIRVLTWNLLGCRGFPRDAGGPVAFPEVQPGLLAALATRLAAWRIDLAILQETPPEAAVREVARQAGMQAAYFPAQVAGGTTWPFGFPGAVLARCPLHDVHDRAAAVRTPGDARFHRHWGTVTAQLAGAPLRLAGTHLCANWGGVDREATRLAELDLLLADEPVELIAGDFNSRPGEAPPARMRAAGWRDAWQEGGGAGDGLTSDTRQRMQRIDYLWLAAQAPWRVRGVQVPDDLLVQMDGGEVLLSDHFPVLAELERA